MFTKLMSTKVGSPIPTSRGRNEMWGKCGNALQNSSNHPPPPAGLGTRLWTESFVDISISPLNGKEMKGEVGGVQSTEVSQSASEIERDDSQRVLSPKKLFKTRDSELPFSEGSLSSCWRHSVGCTPYFTEANAPRLTKLFLADFNNFDN